MERLRHPLWQARLREVLAASRGRAFARGSHDCATFVADAVLAITGHDKLAAIRDRYATERGAYKLLKRLGVRSANEYADKVFAPCRVTLLQRGDLARVPGSGPLTSPAIVLGDHAVTISGDGRAMSIPLHHVTDGWAV